VCTGGKGSAGLDAVPSPPDQILAHTRRAFVAVDNRLVLPGSGRGAASGWDASVLSGAPCVHGASSALTWQSVLTVARIPGWSQGSWRADQGETVMTSWGRLVFASRELTFMPSVD
jgi:hypothetical protein